MYHRRPTEDALPRRAFLGVEVRRDVARGALVIASVTPDGPAARAGARAGDVLVAVGGRAVELPGDVVAATRGVPAGAAVTLAIVRDGGATRLELGANATPLPVERIDGAEVRLDHVTLGPHRLRAVWTFPAGGERPCAALLHLQGIDPGSCEHPLDPEHPVVRLVGDLSRAGVATLRVERSGIGDSEGPPPTETSLADEVATYRAAFDALRAHPEVDARRVFLLGHSLGGMVAPLVARVAPGPTGIAVIGTSARRWRACIVATTERQLRARGFRGAELDERLAAWAQMHALVCRDGWTPRRIFAEKPHLAWLESGECRGDTMFGRHASLFRDLEATDLAAAWRSLGGARVLVLHGANDLICDEGDARTVEAAVGAERARFVALPGVGHDLRVDGRWDGSVARATLAWIAERS